MALIQFVESKPDKPNPEQNGAGIETIAGQVKAMQMLLKAVIADGIRSGALSSDLFVAVTGQALGKFPNNKNLSKSEIFGAVGTLNSILEALNCRQNRKNAGNIDSVDAYHLYDCVTLGLICKFNS